MVYDRCQQAAKRTNVERVLVVSPADSLPLHLAVGYKLSTPDKNRYSSNVIRWKDFIAAGEGKDTGAEPYDRTTPAWWCTPAAPPARPRASC